MDFDVKLFGEGAVQFVFSNCKIWADHDGAATREISVNKDKHDLDNFI